MKLSFPSFQAAYDYLSKNFEYADNFRGAYADESHAEFDEIARGGCCGSEEIECEVAGRAAIVGCNYGH
jgi:hypothetical protein